jgi:MFS family permease
MNKYINFLKNNQIVAKLSLIQFIAYFGAWFSSVAIYSMLVEFNSPAYLITLITITHLLPAVIQAPFSGALIDKIEFKKLMLILLFIEVVMTLLFLTVNSIDDIIYLIIFLFIRMSSSTLHFNIEMTILPNILSGKDLNIANDIHSIIWSFSYAFGMAISGLIVDSFGVKISFLIDALFFITAFILLWNLDFHIEIEKSRESFIKTVKLGIKYIKDNKKIIHLILLHSVVGLTAFDTLITLLADYKYKYIISVPLAIGFINAIRAFALMIGPIILNRYINQKTLFNILLIQGFSIILWGLLQDNFYVSFIGIFLTGFFTSTIWSYTYALLQENTQKEYLGRVVAYNDMIFMLANIITTSFIGIMATLGVSLDTITSFIGVGFLFVSLYYKFYVLKLIQ